MDLSSAFDTVNWTNIYNLCKDILESSDLNALRSLVVNQSLYTRDVNKSSITMKTGIPQGGTLSPLIFSFLIDREIFKVQFDPTKLSLCLYADDIFIISSDSKYLSSILNQITQILKDYSFIANPSKYQIVASLYK